MTITCILRLILHGSSRTECKKHFIYKNHAFAAFLKQDSGYITRSEMRQSLKADSTLKIEEKTYQNGPFRDFIVPVAASVQPERKNRKQMHHSSMKSWKPIRVQLFGHFRVTSANGNEITISGKRVRALLAILCLHPGEAVEREEISQLLWQGKFRAQARASLRQTLLELKQQLVDVCDDPFIGSRDKLAIRAEIINSDLIDLHKALATDQFASAASQLQTLGTQTLLEGLDKGQGLGLAFAEYLETKRAQFETQLMQAAEQIFTGTGARELDFARNFLQDALQQRGHGSKSSEALIRIAILPFAVQSSDETLQLFANGLFEELITTLAQIPLLRVAGRGSARQFASCASAIDTAAKLKVTNLVEGTIRRQNNTIIVNAALLDGVDGCQSWSGRFEGQTDDLFSLQQTLAIAITEELGLVLKRQIKPPPVRRRSTLNKDAYSLYLQG